MEYNKLVRDEIPFVIANSGKRCEIEVFDSENEDHLPIIKKYLMLKLEEEVEELMEALCPIPNQKKILSESKQKHDVEQECADVFEVVNQISKLFGKATVFGTAEKKRKAIGGFEKNIILKEVLG